jgi:hypothetical protein
VDAPGRCQWIWGLRQFGCHWELVRQDGPGASGPGPSRSAGRRPMVVVAGCVPARLGGPPLA